MSSQSGQAEPWVTLGQADDRLRSQVWTDATDAVATAVGLLDGVQPQEDGRQDRLHAYVGVEPISKWPGYRLVASREIPRCRYVATVYPDGDMAVDSLMRMVDYVLYIDPNPQVTAAGAKFVFGEEPTVESGQVSIFGLEGVERAATKRKPRRR
jgi:hypothetical protein